MGSTRQGKLALWQIIARVIDQGSRLSAVRLAASHAARPARLVGGERDFVSPAGDQAESPSSATSGRAGFVESPFSATGDIIHQNPRAARRFWFSAKIPMFNGALPPAEVTKGDSATRGLYIGLRPAGRAVIFSAWSASARTTCTPISSRRGGRHIIEERLFATSAPPNGVFSLRCHQQLYSVWPVIRHSLYAAVSA